MSYGPIQVFTGTIASGTSTLTQVALGKSFSRVYAELGSMSTAAALTVYGSTDGETYRAVYERVNTAPVQYQTLTVATGTVNGIVPLDVSTPYVQLRASAVIDGGCTVKLICWD